MFGFFHDKGLISTNQSSFKPGDSCINQLFSQTRIVGFRQSVNERKDENPTRKTCSEYFKAYWWQKLKT